jgi:NAD+ kinase
MPPIRRLALVVNESKSGAVALGEALAAACARRGVTVKAGSTFPLAAGTLDGVDACCVIGGDGTLLGVVQEAARAQVPVLGVNRGSLGFLTTFTSDEAERGFDAILDGRFRFEARALLDCRTEQGGGLALNDVLVKDDTPSRLARLEVRADGELVTEFFCDGLIFSTPTGSTAYNLSAGGPLIHPHAEAIALTPICPHTLSNRTIIFQDNVQLRVENCHRSGSLLVALDGHSNRLACPRGAISIRLAEPRLLLAVPEDYQHFRVVQTKLRWSGGERSGPAAGGG